MALASTVINWCTERDLLNASMCVTIVLARSRSRTNYIAAVVAHRMYKYLCTTRNTVLHIFRQVLFGAGNQDNHQNFDLSLLSYKCWLILNINFAKILEIGTWVSRINWCKDTNSMQRASMWLNLYGCQGVRCKLKKGLKMHFLCF